jgi:acid ceramidase
MCTSFVVVDQDNNVYHGRNLDYPGQEWFRALTVVTSQRVGNGETARVVQHLGYQGANTGLLAGRFAVSLNYRRSEAPLQLGRIADPRYLRAIGLLWDVLQTCTSYEEAVDLLTREWLIAPAYFIVSGADGRATVITRGATSSSARDIVGSGPLTQGNIDDADADIKSRVALRVFE